MHRSCRFLCAGSFFNNDVASHSDVTSRNVYLQTKIKTLGKVVSREAVRNSANEHIFLV